jgi:hypothetical protein
MQGSRLAPRLRARRFHPCARRPVTALCGLAVASPTVKSTSTLTPPFGWRCVGFAISETCERPIGREDRWIGRIASRNAGRRPLRQPLS